jgi:hypothetical protein
VRERGAQEVPARAADGELQPTPPPTGGLRFWQVLAVVALIAATAGWTTVAVMTLRPAPASEAVVSSTDEPALTDDASPEPPVESHAVADLEALLPAEINGTSLTRESWTGDTILGDDSWSSSLARFLAAAGKTAADLQVSQAYDAAGTLDLSAGALRVAGLDAAALRDAMIDAWKGDYPDLKIAQSTIGGLDVTTGDFGEGAVNSYWYLGDGVVFDIETSDPSIALAALSALATAGASSVPSPS